MAYVRHGISYCGSYYFAAAMKKILLAFVLVATNVQLHAQVLRFVKQSGTGNGSSWSNASSDLQLMINNSAPGDSIFVAAGTYTPTRLAHASGTISVNNRFN